MILSGGRRDLALRLRLIQIYEIWGGFESLPRSIPYPMHLSLPKTLLPTAQMVPVANLLHPLTQRQ